MCIRFAGKPDLVDTVVICHPGKFTTKDVKKIKIPNSWVCSEGKDFQHGCFFLTLIADDTFFPAALRDKCEAEFVSRRDKESFVEYEFKEYKGSFLSLYSFVLFSLKLSGTAHGFALRPNLDIPEIKAAFEGALEQTVDWFKKTLI